VALVTGAAAGLGQEIAVALAAQGAEIIGLDIGPLEQTAEMVAEAGSELRPAQADITDEAAATTAIDQATSAAGRLDILVNNAGIYPVRPFAETSLEDWRAVMSVNLDGTFVVTHAALPHLRRQEMSRIVNISSSSIWLGVPGLVTYITSKMGLIGFTRALAAETAEDGVTVNAITPGLLETPTAVSGGVGEFFDFVVENQAVKRRMGPGDLVSTVLYLCDPASAFITGQTINVDGGFAKH
jgi:3-oxoacyl-[acyl-carrier protein] reductase